MRRARWIGKVLIMMVWACGSVKLHAQSTKVELSGLVSDPAGLPIAGAEVRLGEGICGMVAEARKPIRISGLMRGMLYLSLIHI